MQRIWGVMCLTCNHQLFGSPSSPQLCSCDLWYFLSVICIMRPAFVLDRSFFKSSVPCGNQSNGEPARGATRVACKAILKSRLCRSVRFHSFKATTTSAFPLPRKCQAKFFSIKWEMRSDCYKRCGRGLFVVCLFVFYMRIHLLIHHCAGLR